MKKFNKSFLVALAALFLFGAASAQTVSFRLPSIWVLLLRDEVVADLNLDEAVKKKVDAAWDDVLDSAGAQRLPGGFMMTAGGDPKQMEKDVEAKLKGVLTAANLTRLEQLRIQISGIRAAMDPKVAEKLGITEAQSKQLKAEVDSVQAKIQSLTQDNGGMVNMQVAKEMDQIKDASLPKMEKILTAEQLAKLKEMGGKPLKKAEKPG